MESTFNNFETAFDSILFEDQQPDFATQTFSFPGGDDDEEEDGNDDAEDKSNGADDDNPPLDDDVVHSPLPTQPGGKPKTGKG